MAKVSPTYGKGVAGDDYTPSTIAELGDMIGKIAYSVIWDNTAKDKLAVFDKMPIDKGDTIEEAVVKMAESLAYDADGEHALDRETSEKFAVAYYKNWGRKKFKKTVDVAEMRKVLSKEQDVSDVSAKIVSSMTEGDIQEKYEDLRDLFAWGKQSADGGTGAVLVKADTVAYDSTNSTIDYKGVLISLKDTIKGMQYVNTNFNSASLKRRTRPEDMVIVMPYKLRNRLDVGELASLFNLEKAEINQKIIEVDTDVDVSGYYDIFVVDKHAVLAFTRLYEMVNQLNADGLFWNYFLHVERLYALSALFDGCYIRVATQAPEN